MTEFLHVTERTTWESALPTGGYRISTKGVSLEEQGFIHFSLAHQLRTVAELLYRDADEPLVVLVIDGERLTAPVRYEAMEPGGDEFPHLYGELPTTAVIRVVPVERDSGGRMILPE
ncbi:DUF952 domain-containing protein [Actinoplanes sp. NPDC051851]|uniref:DUF952 domain-containing protein n=1 Tax=Actinoplanes sp. NPDC051851 TaxID=3154753 RepID=UPI00341670F7